MDIKMFRRLFKNTSSQQNRSHRFTLSACDFHSNGHLTRTQQWTRASVGQDSGPIRNLSCHYCKVCGHILWAKYAGILCGQSTQCSKLGNTTAGFSSQAVCTVTSIAMENQAQVRRCQVSSSTVICILQSTKRIDHSFLVGNQEQWF